MRRLLFVLAFGLMACTGCNDDDDVTAPPLPEAECKEEHGCKPRK